MRTIKDTIIIAKYDLKLFFRYPGNILWLILAPFIFSIIGLMLVHLVGKDNFYTYIGGNQSGLMYVLCGYAVFALSNYCWQSNNKIESEMVQGTAKTNFIQPINKLSYLYGLCISTICSTGIFSLVILLAISIINHISFLIGIKLLLSCIMVTLNFFGIASIISAISVAYKKIGGLTNIITFALQVISGMMIPLRIFPETIRKILSIFPTSLAIDCIRSLILYLNPMHMWNKQILLLMIYALVLNVAGYHLTKVSLIRAKKLGTIDSY